VSSADRRLLAPVGRHTRAMHDDDDLDGRLDRGLAFDLGTIVSRRTILAVALGTGAAVMLAACGDDDSTAPTTSESPASTESSATGPSSGPGSGPGGPGGPPPGGAPGGPAGGGGTTTTNADTGLSAVPEETAGPFPGDGSNGVNVLAESGIVRSDIRSSFGAASGTSKGVPMTLQMTIVDVATKQPLEGAAVYVWHCDNEGNYSLYSQAAADQNYLRGVQVTGADGLVSFTSNYPACYSGRWPHIHYEVYPSVDSMTDAGNKIATSQLALPDDVNTAVFATDLYSGSAANYAGMSLSGDNVFSDGTTGEEPTVSGDVTKGYAVTITSPVITT
jgi:protocatechuate 3,4-dioxygenase beta subunit